MKKQLIALSLTLAMVSTTALAAPSSWVTAEVDTVPTGDWDYQAPITCEGFCDLVYPKMSMLRLDQWLFRWRTNQEDYLDPDDTLTREQVAVAVYELAKELDIELLYKTPNYTDTGDISQHAQYAVGVLQTANMMNGYTDGRFAPQGACTVEQTIVLLSRLAQTTSTVKLCNRNGIETAIPLEIIDQLLINPHDLGEDDLIEVYEKESYEQSKADFGTEYGAGFLFGLERYTQGEYEEYLCYDMAGHSVFAKDDLYYYGKTFATDVQFYRSDMDAYNDESLAEWVALLDTVDVIVEDVIYRNSLTPYSDSIDREKDYTYDSEHMTICYNPYGNGESYYTLTLSQPVTQGASGIWCVERFEDTYGNVYLWFPSGAEGVDVSAEDYYAQAQADCNAGFDTSRLDPMAVAQDFADTWFQAVPENATFEVVETTDHWGITLTATDVTPTGMTLLCTQTGGTQQGRLQTGTPYCLEVYQDGRWETVDYLPQDYNIGWTAIAWNIPENQTTEWIVDWDWLYGDLSSGTYRIGKSVMDFIEAGIYEEQMYYAVFEIL